MAIGACEVVVYETCMYFHPYIAMTFDAGYLGADRVNVIEVVLTAKKG